MGSGEEKRNDSIGHPLEIALGASARDILDAIARGFRAQVDVRGKLAELYLYRDLQALQAGGSVSDLVWSDKDGEPDFFLDFQGRRLSIQCKNVRSGEQYRSGGKEGLFKVELQKTRSGIDLKTGERTRYYRPDEFDIVAACLFNQTGQWRFLYAAAGNLARHRRQADRLEVMHAVPEQATPPWHDDLLDALQVLFP